MSEFQDIQEFFQQCYQTHGNSAEGVGWNSAFAQEVRFDQLLKVIHGDSPFSLIEFGCGYGHLVEYMVRKQIYPAQYYGVDVAENSLAAARERFAERSDVFFSSKLDDVPVCDYLCASGVFNIKLGHDNHSWTRYVIENLTKFNAHAPHGFSVNFLTKYSDYERMAERPDLYYADPCFLFDYCKSNFSRNVALLHDYELYDFTLIVRK